MSDNEERWKNFALFKIYATDEEIGIIGLIIFGLAVVAVIAYGVWRLIQWL